MWNHRYLSRVDFRIFPLVFAFMIISLLVISSMTSKLQNPEGDVTFTMLARSQLQWFGIGWLVFFFFAGLDYRKFREWTWFLYIFMLILLVGVYFANPIQNVHRWYRIPGLGMSFQPSEYAKLIVVLSLGWFLEKKGSQVSTISTAMQVGLIVGIPFLMILKQPDLGTALVLYPITLIMCYFGGVHPTVLRFLSGLGLIAIFVVSLFFTGIVSHEKMKPIFTKVLKEYQYERFNPNTYHQQAAQTAIAIGGVFGKGFGKSDYSSRKWLPATPTDSIFAAYGEEFGFVGMTVLLALYFGLSALSFRVAVVAKDAYGKLLAAGLAIYLTMHILVNITMMCGFLPISGVPLIFLSYGGNSVLTTMAALGILQSIYTRRFMF